jgi:Nitrate and nitrite sensing
MSDSNSVVIILLFGSVVFSLVLLWRKIKKIKYKNFLRSIEIIKCLRELLYLLQKHRGMTTGFINGNRKVKDDVSRVAEQIDLTFISIQAKAKWLLQDVKWSNIVDHWSRLQLFYTKRNTEGLLSENNFKQHNLLIANLLYLIDDVADQFHLKRSVGNTTDTDWRYLLSIAEYIGQVRALGTGVAAKGDCSNVARVQMTHLCKKIASSVDSSWLEESRQQIEILIASTEKELLVDHPQVDPEAYFSLASQAIEQVLKQFDKQIDLINYK